MQPKSKNFQKLGLVDGDAQNPACNFCCLSTHSWNWIGRGQLAVQSFFMVSGYLISFVLTGSRTYSKVWRFFINRALRIFPLYWLVAFATLAFFLSTSGSGGGTEFFNAIRQLPFAGTALITISNFLIFGQDQIMFLSVQNSMITYTGDFWNSEVLIFKALLVPQAWSLGIELTFYILAPFILKNKYLLLGLFFGSLSLRALLVFYGFGLDDPWSYRFFPTELALFLLGAISHQFISRRISKKLMSNTFVCAGVLAAMILLIVNYDIIADTIFPKGIVLFVSLSFALPFLFEFQSSSRVDTYLGHLSYPIYLWHIFVTSVLGWIGLQTDYAEINSPILVLAVSAILSLLTFEFLEKRIQLLRRAIRTA